MSKSGNDWRAFMLEEDAVARRRHEHHRERRRKATLAGLHLPDTLELATGFPYLGGRLAADAQAYAERLLPRLRQGPKGLVAALEAVTVTPDLGQLQNLAWETREAASDGRWRKLKLRQHILRFDAYAAAAGCPDAPLRVATGIAALTYQSNLAVQERASLVTATLGWLLVATEPPGRNSPGRPPVRERAGELGALAVRRLVDAYGPETVEADLDSIPNGHRPQRRFVPIAEAPAAAPPIALDVPDNGFVVLREVGAPDTEDGRKICDTWAELVGARLPVVEVPGAVGRIFADLVSRFPHAAPVVAAIRSDLTGRRDLAFRPTIFVGDPGAGKTAFVRAMLTALGIPYEVVSCAAAYHHAITGTDRHWTSAAPSLPMRLVWKHRSASAVIVLDELEKASTGGGREGRGGTFDALLPLLEPGTASGYLEKFFQAPCNLSRISWLGTANDLEGIPAPLRDRVRIVRFPNPASEHLSTLATSLLRDAVASRGLDPRWALPLDGLELQALAAAWPGGSLRNLGRLVEAVLDARDHCPSDERN